MHEQGGPPQRLAYKIVDDSPRRESLIVDYYFQDAITAKHFPLNYTDFNKVVDGDKRMIDHLLPYLPPAGNGVRRAFVTYTNNSGLDEENSNWWGDEWLDRKLVWF